MGGRLIRDQRGMTLVEMGITLAIAGIVATLALPSMVGVMPKLRLNNDTFTLANEIALARARSIAKNQEFRIIFDPAGDSYTLRNKTEGINFATNNTSGEIDLYQVDNLATKSTLAVMPVGKVGRVKNASDDFEDFPIGDVARVYLQTQDGAHRRRVVVESTGRVHTERWTGGATWVEE